jgi:hypothetical protein
VPLDTPLDVVQEDDGWVRVLDGEALVVEARPAPELDVEVPAPVSPEQARKAAARYRGSSDGVFSRCFVCGPAREDAFGVFAGEVEGRQLVASPWTPPSWTADAAGSVLPEFVWAVLDCPTYFALYMRRAADERARPANRANRCAGCGRRGARGDGVVDRHRGPETSRRISRAVARRRASCGSACASDRTARGIGTGEPVK